MQPMNPYIVGNAVGGSPTFIGRDDILQGVYRTLQNPGQNAILLHGQRRIGKTSILRELEAKLPSKGNYCPIFIDLHGKAHEPIVQIVQDLANQISDKLGKAKPQLGEVPKTYFHDTWLPNLLNTEENTSIVLLLDEFDALDDDLAKQTRSELFRYLHDLLAIHRERLNFVFVIGRNVGDLTEIAHALFKQIPTRQVSLLGREETLKLIHLSEDTLQWSKKAEDRIWQLTQGHPYVTQQVCCCVWEHLYRDNVTKTPSVSPKHIEEIIPTVVERSQGALEWLWDGLEAAQKVFLSAVAMAGDKIVTKDQLNNWSSSVGIKISVPALENAPQSLLDSWDLIKMEGHGYRFKVELMRRLVATYKPLSSVKKELNLLQPEADKYYQAAVKLHAEKKPEEALDELGRVLRLNPNHIEAPKLQTSILLEQGKLVEAYKQSEKLFESYPEEARPLLIQTLWNQAQSARTEGERLNFYQKILQFDDNHANAKKEIRKIWQRRAERALRDDDCKGAVSAYQQAGLKDKAFEVKKKCFWDKYLRVFVAVGIFFLVLLISWSVQHFWLEQGIPWWVWGPLLGIVLASLTLIKNWKPPETID